ncbi:MAG TPA: isocitrate lyase/PEP mutase family protein [Candidatus Sulfotelmatobacter sp.]|nr:isocitrate lyase/PEP mutase family protein [Candidatus Sulfotelmatobacter sp.]
MTQSMTKARKMRELLRTERPVVSPGVYEGYGLLLVEAMGFKAAGVSGSALSNSLILQPDIGLLSLRENVDACRHLARSVSIPLMADADTGYGNAVSVYHVVQYFEEAGIVGINIEDQVMPKRCGHMRGKELIEPREMAMKIEAALKAKKDPDFILNARTDAIAVEGIEGAVKRVKLYAAAGADMIYPDAVRNEDDVKRLVDAVPDAPVNIGMGFGIRSRPTTPLFSLRRLKELGVARASMPRMLSSSALAGMRKALEVMKQCMETGEAADRPDLTFSMEDITKLVGYERVTKLEQALLTDEQLERKYGDGEREYVIRQGDFGRSGVSD